MDPNNVQEHNIEIAAFMGAELAVGPAAEHEYPKMAIRFQQITHGLYVHAANQLGYHCSWDWLMPVVEKIETISDSVITKVFVSINGYRCDMWTNFDPAACLRDVKTNGWPANFRGKLGKTKIEGTYTTVIEFIKWYTQQTKS